MITIKKIIIEPRILEELGGINSQILLGKLYKKSVAPIIEDIKGTLQIDPSWEMEEKYNNDTGCVEFKWKKLIA